MVGNSRKRQRVLHASDLHLETLNDKACRSLEAMVDLAISTKVDLVIIAGDLFDHNRIDNSLVSFVAEKLRRLPVYTAILPGNHDSLVTGSAFKREKLWQGCENIRIFKAPEGEILAFPGLGISLWGKPITSDTEDVRPLVGLPPPEKNGCWNIVVAHGYYVGAEPPLFPSYHITEEEVVSSGWDYIALGHIISFKCVCSSPVAYYGGSPSLTGTVAIVDLAEETGVQVTPYFLLNK